MYKFVLIALVGCALAAPAPEPGHLAAYHVAAVPVAVPHSVPVATSYANTYKLSYKSPAYVATAPAAYTTYAAHVAPVAAAPAAYTTYAAHVAPVAYPAHAPHLAYTSYVH